MKSTSCSDELGNMLMLYWQCKGNSTLYPRRSTCTCGLCMYLNMHMKAHGCSKWDAYSAFIAGWVPSFSWAYVQRNPIYLHWFQNLCCIHPSAGSADKCHMHSYATICRHITEKGNSKFCHYRTPSDLASKRSCGLLGSFSDSNRIGLIVQPSTQNFENTQLFNYSI